MRILGDRVALKKKKKKRKRNKAHLLKWVKTYSLLAFQSYHLFNTIPDDIGIDQCVHVQIDATTSRASITKPYASSRSET